MQIVLPVPSRVAGGVAIIQSDFISQSSYQNYSSSVSFNAGERVNFAGTDYESIIGSNLGNFPTINPDKWVEVGASNLFRIVDSSLSLKMQPTEGDINNKTYFFDGVEYGGFGSPSFISGETGGASFTYSLSIDNTHQTYVDTFALLGVSDVRIIKIKTADYSDFNNPVFKYYEIDVLNNDTPSWVDYIKSSDNNTTDVLFSIDKVFTTYRDPAVELPQSYIEVLLLPNDVDFFWQVKPVKVAEVVGGRSFALGKTRHAGLNLSIQDFSRIERDNFGNSIIQRRAFAKRMSVPFIIPKSQVDLTQRVLADARGSAELYIADESVKSSIIFGLYNDFYISYEDFDHVVGEVEVLGLPE